ncbi:M56 family metallopeptidase [Luteibacter sp. 9135]|uniref:M56 family metallopeptidase n=1 Tax=Luteibacter sp. 9135 TaxID=1500893 RepID=UPI00056066F8|nr:M56 family metallopeptidase [Luteibacter sp. 9135]
MSMLLDEMLSRLIHASLQAILLCGAIYTVCRLVPTMSASARTVLWWLLGAQLVVGVISPTLIALPVLPAIATVTAADDATAVMPLTLPGAFPAASLVTPAGNDIGDAGFSWAAMLLFTWALGVIVQAVVAVFRWRTLAGVAARAMPHDDVRVETLCARRARELGLRRSPRLAVSTEVHSPQVIGFWRPTILLPLHDHLSDDELDLALMHELAHVRRGDLMLGWIPATARTLFFFHPLVHLAVREYALCREAACDALVVSRGDTLAKTYGRLLVRMGVAPHPHHALPGASPTFRTLKRRLLMLAQANDTHPRMLTLCVVTVLALGGVFPWRMVAAHQATPPAPARAAVAAAPAAAMTTDDPVPARPAAPAAPVRTDVTPVTPATPAAPVTSTSRTTDITEIHGQPTDGFVFSSDDIHVATGTASDLARAEAAYRADARSFVWYRRGTQAWILRDPAYIKRIHAAYQEVSHPADKGAASAGKQADIDRQESMLERQQAMLNEQMAKLSAQQASLVSREVGPSGPRDGAAYAAGHATIASEQAAVAQKMAAIGQQRAAQGKAMAEWGRRQSEASRKASEEVNTILAEAIRNHVAQPAR